LEMKNLDPNPNPESISGSVPIDLKGWIRSGTLVPVLFRYLVVVLSTDLCVSEV